MRSAALACCAAAALVAGCAALPGWPPPSADEPGERAQAPRSGEVALAIPARGGGEERIPMAVQRPAGGGPFPAVVVLHDCSGLGPHSSGAPKRWSDALVARGFVVVRPDSFSTRGFPRGVCTDPSPGRAQVGPWPRAADAWAALRWLRSQPDVDARRVAVLGGSHGGSTVLAAVARPPAGASGAGFAAAVALYPGCGAVDARRFAPATPLLVLAGELDDWTPAPACARLVDEARGRGADASIHVYPGARHGFDGPGPVRYSPTRVNANAPGGRGATTGGDPAAWADAIVRVGSFLDDRLAR